MATEDRIECQSCRRAVVPQLWVDDRNRMEHPTVVHLCPFCGVVLRESGGRRDRRMLAFFLGFSFLCLLLIALLLLMARH